jgi:hypothetical protein
MTIDAHFLAESAVNVRMVSDEADAALAYAAPVWGDAQGAWYTVEYLIAATVERVDGREALIATMCDPHRLLVAYESAVRRSPDPALPRWSPRLMQHLTGNPS